MINLKDKLSHLTYRQACGLLGQEGEKLIQRGGAFDDIDISKDLMLSKDMLTLDLHESVVTISLDPAKNHRLKLQCNTCSGVCAHMGAALSLVLEEKLSLGLSAPPPERTPVESLSEEELITWAVAERSERAKTEKMKLVSADSKALWTDYIVTSHASGKSYRLALRGWARGESFCSCPDYRINTLGTCKHILFTLDTVRKKFSKTAQQRPYVIRNIAVYVKYGEKQELRLLISEKLDSKAAQLVRPYKDRPIDDVKGLVDTIGVLEKQGNDVTVYPDAEEYINTVLYIERVREKVAEIRKDPAHHPLRKALLKTELLPYQLDGIAFAAGAGRAVLADDMGLGKTIQGLGVAELLSQDIDISKVLVICPASLKSQWRLEIKRFSNRDCQVVLGSAPERAQQYAAPCFFSICNYEQVLRDIKVVETVHWDLIILDEGQRIKNWEAKTSRTIKALKSPFALVLSGTPLENRLDELFSVVEFIDYRRLGPAFRFYNRYRVTDERGKVLGYKNLDDLRQRLKPVLLRRTRKQVMKELPPRTTEIRRIPPTDEQLAIHDGQKRIISGIVRKRYFTEMDFLRLQKALLLCRMSANSTYLVDKQHPGYSSKLEELDVLLGQLMDEDDRKVILFSEWTTMLNLIEPLLHKRKLDFVRLDGTVPQKKRQALMHAFQTEPSCKLFITTNAGSTGINLQAANTVINVDLPWNPAVLEQRIARAHRMGQKRPVQVFLLVTENTLEENLLTTLSAKQVLAVAALDPDATTNKVELASGIEEMKLRLELLLGTKPDAPADESMKALAENEVEALARREKVAQAGGQLISAAFSFIGELFSGKAETEQEVQLAGVFKKQFSECLEKGKDGDMKLTITLPTENALDNIARTLARLAARGYE
jgi:superfamily II DNA or RNA helicase